MTQDLLDRYALAEERLARGEWRSAEASLGEALGLVDPAEPGERCVRVKLLLGLVAARLRLGQDAEAEATELLDWIHGTKTESRRDVEAPRARAEVRRRAAWVAALELLGKNRSEPRQRALLRDLENVLDEPPEAPAPYDVLSREAHRHLNVAESLESAAQAGVDGELERSDSFLSLALADAEDLGTPQRAQAGFRAATILSARRESSRARSLLSSLVETAEREGDAITYFEAARRLGDGYDAEGSTAEAWGIFDRARALAKFSEEHAHELLFLRRLARMAADRKDLRAVDGLEDEIESCSRLMPDEQRQSAAISAWVLASIHQRSGRLERARAAFSRTLEHAEAARSMEMAWLAAAQLGSPLQGELVRRLQRPPVEAADLLSAARTAKEFPGDLELVRGLLEGATRLLPFEPYGVNDLAREIESELSAITPVN